MAYFPQPCIIIGGLGARVGWNRVIWGPDRHLGTLFQQMAAYAVYLPYYMHRRRVADSS
jgi:hypothetical protein